MNLMKGRFLSFLSKESDEIRNVRTRLSQYRETLDAEIQLARKGVELHGENFQSLLRELVHNESRMHQWGLQPLLPMLHMQLWLRQSRATWLQSQAKLILRLLEGKLAVTEALLNEFFYGRGSSLQLTIETINREFCKSPEDLWHYEWSLSKGAIRAKALDIVCSRAATRFRSTLPLMESTAPAKYQAVRALVARYAAALLVREPERLDAANYSWTDFCVWYVARQKELSYVEREFGYLIADERDREGRLFTRWAALVLSAASGVAPNPTAQLTAAQVSSPRSISSFVEYFSMQVLAVVYQVPGELSAALKALTEVLAHRKVQEAVMRYPNKSVERSDLLWRLKCGKFRLVDPVSYGVLECYRQPCPSIGFRASKDTSPAQNPQDVDSAANLGTSPLFPDTVLDNARDVDCLSEHAWLERLPELKFSVFLDKESLNTEQRTLRRSFVNYVSPYARSVRVAGLLSSCICPRHVLWHLNLWIRLLYKDIHEFAGRKDCLGADLLFPVFVMVLSHAAIPCPHLLLHVVTRYECSELQGELAYYLTTFEAAVAYVMEMQTLPAAVCPPDVISSEDQSSAQDEQLDEDLADRMQKLGCWLRDQQTMEESLEILESDGWMS